MNYLTIFSELEMQLPVQTCPSERCHEEIKEKKNKTSLFLPFGQTLNDASEEVWVTHFVNDLEVARTLWRGKQQDISSLLHAAVYSDFYVVRPDTSIAIASTIQQLH